MARRRKKRTVRRSRKRSYTKRRRRNPRGKPHQITVYRRGRGKSARLVRGPRYRLKPKRVNPRRRKRYAKRKGSGFRVQRYFKQATLNRVLGIGIGLGGGVIVKQLLNNMLPDQPLISRGVGIATFIAGGIVNFQSKKNSLPAAVGTGMMVYGLIDAIVTNVPFLAQFFPVISGPAAFAGGMGYGRSVMGASLQTGAVEIVGSNISTDIAPEIVGWDDGSMDLADALEYSM